MPIESLGVSRNFYPPIAGKYNGKKLLICGGAACVWDDLRLMCVSIMGKGCELLGFDVMAVNDIISHLPLKLDHAYSNDVHQLPFWIGARRHEYQRLDAKIEIHTGVTADSHAMNSWPWPMHGSSGLNACYTGLGLGYDEIVLAGIPLDDSGHYFDPPWRSSAYFLQEVPDRDDGQPRYWTKARDYVFDGKVKSLSGRTKVLLGSP